MEGPEYVRSYFTRLSPDHRERHKANYELLIAIEYDKAPERFNKKTGRSMPYQKMPWMLSAWENGLRILNKVINQIDNATDIRN